MRFNVIQESIASLPKTETISVKDLYVEKITKTEKSRNVFVTIMRESIRTSGTGSCVS